MGIIWSYVAGPWRNVEWWNNQENVNWLGSCGPEKRPIKILLYGPVGAGKSSYINSVQSALRNRIHNQTAVGAIGGRSFTRGYTVHTIPREGGGLFPFVLVDTVGLEKEQPTEEIIKQALRGRLRSGYEFKAGENILQDPFYNHNPVAADQVDVAVCVCPMNIAFPLDDRTLNGMQAITLEARDLNIPHLAILTKVDLVSPLSNWNLGFVYREASIKLKMEQFSAGVGIPMNCIFPVKNYHEETSLDRDITALVLDALKNIVTTGLDHFEEVQPRNQ
ncbi:interferon-induced protein 44-like [Nelusetta ayraudi]|uniref:interferon-induced protein 44-like n=1 Tax=Nelusetta ayraudi TaxID=303726 RepID=UPI003F71830B